MVCVWPGRKLPKIHFVVSWVTLFTECLKLEHTCNHYISALNATVQNTTLAEYVQILSTTATATPVTVTPAAALLSGVTSAIAHHPILDHNALTSLMPVQAHLVRIMVPAPIFFLAIIVPVPVLSQVERVKNLCHLIKKRTLELCSLKSFI